jgi:hypothetical protein
MRTQDLLFIAIFYLALLILVSGAWRELFKPKKPKLADFELDYTTLEHVGYVVRHGFTITQQTLDCYHVDGISGPRYTFPTFRQACEHIEARRARVKPSFLERNIGWILALAGTAFALLIGDTLIWKYILVSIGAVLMIGVWAYLAYQLVIFSWPYRRTILDWACASAIGFCIGFNLGHFS